VAIPRGREGACCAGNVEDPGYQFEANVVQCDIQTAAFTWWSRRVTQPTQRGAEFGYHPGVG
jgi:hypothetical protein